MSLTLQPNDIVIYWPFRGERKRLVFPGMEVCWPFIYFGRALKMDGPMRLLDIGACAGSFLLPFISVSSGSTIDAFEPSSKAWPYLMHNCGDVAGVTLHKMAASSRAGTATLSTFEHSAGRVLGVDSLHGDGVDAEEVETVRLDDFIEGPVDMMKVDVEGHELDVFKGAENILRAHKPELLVELKDVRQKQGGHTIDELVQYLVRLGYGIPQRFANFDYLFRWSQA